MHVFCTPDDFIPTIGTEIGVSDWLVVDQKRIDTFAEATGDDQWIHTDPGRAAAGPFGSTVAHGYLTLALVVPLIKQIYRVESRMAINYGLNKVRFPTPVLVDSRLRARLATVGAERDGEMAAVLWRTTLELEGADKPACVAENVTRFHF